MSRYIIGNEYVFFQVKITQGTLRFGSAYCLWLGDKIDSFESIVLTCIEEHAVSNAYTEEKNCLGYLFKDKDGKVWANQYPVAHYGQLDDSADGHVRRYFSRAEDMSLTEEAARDWLRSPDGQIYDTQFFHPYNSAQRLLGDCYRGKKHVPEHADEIQTYIDYLEGKLNELGFTHSMEPISEKHPNFIVPRVKKIAAQAVAS